MIIDGDDARAVYAALPRGLRARMSMAVMQSPADIRLYVHGALVAVPALDVAPDGTLRRGDAPRENALEAALARFDRGFTGDKAAAKAVDKQLGALLSREERLAAMLEALQAAGKRLEVQLVDAPDTPG